MEQEIKSEEVMSMVPVISGEIDVLSKVERRQDGQKLNGKVLSRIVNMDNEITCYQKFVSYRGCDGKERVNTK